MVTRHRGRSSHTSMRHGVVKCLRHVNVTQHLKRTTYNSSQESEDFWRLYIMMIHIHSLNSWYNYDWIKNIKDIMTSCLHDFVMHQQRQQPGLSLFNLGFQQWDEPGPARRAHFSLIKFDDVWCERTSKISRCLTWEFSPANWKQPVFTVEPAMEIHGIPWFTCTSAAETACAPLVWAHFCNARNSWPWQWETKRHWMRQWR